METTLEKSGFIMLCVDLDFIERRDEVIKAMRGLDSDYHRIGYCEKLYGVYDIVAEVLLPSGLGTKDAVGYIKDARNRITALKIGKKKPIVSGIAMLIADKATAVYHE